MKINKNEIKLLLEVEFNFMKRTGPKVKLPTLVPNSKIKGQTVKYDNCYTAIMKLIGLSDKLKKYPTHEEFLKAYNQKYGAFVIGNRINLSDVKRGTILDMVNKQNKIRTRVRKFDGSNLIANEEAKLSGHMMLVLENIKNKKFKVLNNTYVDRNAKGSDGYELELKITEIDDKLFKDSPKYSRVPVLLDYNKMKKL